MKINQITESKYKCSCHPGDSDPDCPVHGLEPMDVGDALDVTKGVAEGSLNEFSPGGNSASSYYAVTANFVSEFSQQKEEEIQDLIAAGWTKQDLAQAGTLQGQAADIAHFEQVRDGFLKGLKPGFDAYLQGDTQMKDQLGEYWLDNDLPLNQDWEKIYGEPWGRDEYDEGVAEGSLNEFVLPGGGGGDNYGGDLHDILMAYISRNEPELLADFGEDEIDSVVADMVTMGMFDDIDPDNEEDLEDALDKIIDILNDDLPEDQGVAEGSGDGYYYLQGGIERSKKFASEEEAMAHSKRFFQLARVSRVTLKYKEPGQPAVVVKEFTFNDAPPPKSQMSWGDFYLQNKKQGMEEGEVTRTPTGLTHRATDRYGAGDDDHQYKGGRSGFADPGKYARDLETVNKQLVKDLDASMGITWKNRGTKGVEVDEGGDKVGNMDADKFDAAMDRLKKLAGAGPLKTVYDPQKRVYKNVPTAVQPKK